MYFGITLKLHNMICIPFCILGLAAGVYLLMQVKHLGLGGLYRNLAWLVVLLSLLFMTCCAVRAVRHHRHMSQCTAAGHCDMKGGEACPYMKDGHEGCTMHGGMGGGSCCDMPCCAKSHCTTGSAEGCCAKDSAGKKCEMGKAPCCHKDGAADSATHK